MNVVFSPRALGNVQRILADSERLFGIAVAESTEKRLSKAFEHIAQNPDGAPQVAGRSNLHALLLTGYPFWVFYRIEAADVEIVHVRHTSRRPWKSI